MRTGVFEVWTGLVVTVLCVSAAIPVVLAQRAGDQPITGPAWWWWSCFALFVGAQSTTAWGHGGANRKLLDAAFGVQIVVGAALVLGAPGVGWLPVLLIVTAATAALSRSWNVVAAVVLVNTAVVAAAAGFDEQGAVSMVMFGVVYLLSQTVSVVGIAVFRRSERRARELSALLADLRATSVLVRDAARLDERLRIARDLHDALGHELTALTLELEIAGHRPGPGQSEHLDRARTIASSLLTQIRSTVGQLREHEADAADAITAAVAELPQPRIHLDLQSVPDVDHERVHALVRCVQEVITNTIRHSDAQNLWIRLAADEATSELTLVTCDDGGGGRPVQPGHGITGLRERIEALGGTVTIDNRDGFRLVTTLPAT